MKKEYNRPEIEIINLSMESIMDFNGGITLSGANPNDKMSIGIGKNSNK